MSKPACVFHHAAPVGPDGRSGSRVRPYQMLKAFEALGYEVFAVTGFARERKRHIRRIKSAIAAGRKFSFAYSESNTLPIQLTESHHVPLYPQLDFQLFRELKDAGVPIGLFYRDVYWQFDHFRHTYGAPKRHIASHYFRVEWRQYLRLIDHLFLPSSRMLDALPSPWPNDSVSALPPGVSSYGIPMRVPRAPWAQMRLLYVGGVAPPLYDLTPLFDAMRSFTLASLTLCCRREEWEEMSAGYDVPDNVTITHRTGEDLDGLYFDADAVCIIRRWHPYLRFAMPVKVAEAISYGLPIFASAGTETSRFVEQQQLGWAVTSRRQFQELIMSLIEQPEDMQAAYMKVANAQRQNTWIARAEQVASTLSDLG